MLLLSAVEIRRPSRITAWVFMWWPRARLLETDFLDVTSIIYYQLCALEQDIHYSWGWLYIYFFLDGCNIFISLVFLFPLFTTSVTFYLTQYVQNTMISTFNQLYKIANWIIFRSMYALSFQNTKCLELIFVILVFKRLRREDCTATLKITPPVQLHPCMG